MCFKSKKFCLQYYKTNNLKFYKLTTNYLIRGSEMWIIKKNGQEQTGCRAVKFYPPFTMWPMETYGKWNKTGNVRTPKHGGAFVQPILQWKSNKYYIFWVCVFRLRYPTCNAHASYCHLWPVRLHHIFPHYLVNGRIFVKKLLSTKLIFSTTFIWNISHSKKK
jgi:hypothetical protein